MRTPLQTMLVRSAFVAVAVTLSAASAARSQARGSSPSQSSSGTTSVPSTNRLPSPTSVWIPDYNLGNDPNYTHRQRTARRDEAKRHLSENAAKLLELTEQLNASLTERPATAEDSKRLDDIAKLARSVRDGMRQ